MLPGIRTGAYEAPSPTIIIMINEKSHIDECSISRRVGATGLRDDMHATTKKAPNSTQSPAQHSIHMLSNSIHLRAPTKQYRICTREVEENQTKVMCDKLKQ